MLLVEDEAIIIVLERVIFNDQLLIEVKAEGTSSLCISTKYIVDQARLACLGIDGSLELRKRNNSTRIVKCCIDTHVLPLINIE